MPSTADANPTLDAGDPAARAALPIRRTGL